MGWIFETIAFSIPILIILGGLSLLFWIQNQPLAGAVLLLSAAILLFLFFFHFLLGSFRNTESSACLAERDFFRLNSLKSCFLY